MKNKFQKAPQPPDQLFQSFTKGLYRITGEESTDTILDMIGSGSGSSNAGNVQVAASDIGSGVVSSTQNAATGSLQSGKTMFNNTESGYILGVDSSVGVAKFYIGNPSNYLNWDGTTLTVVGSFNVSSINIPDNVTANSFHVDNTGNTWWGATTLGASVASVLNTGVASFTRITINGGPNAVFVSDTLDTSSKTILKDFTFSPSDYSGAFKSGTIAWNTTTGAVTSGSGIIMYKNGIVGASSGSVTFSIDATTGNAAFSGAITASSVTGTTITGGTLQTATSGQRIRLVSSSASTPSQNANSLMLINSSSSDILDLGSNASIIMRILPTNNDTGALLIQNDSSLALTSNLVEFDVTKTTSSATALLVTNAGTGSAIIVSTSTSDQTNYMVEFTGGSNLRNIFEISSAFNSNNANTMLHLSHTGANGVNTLFRIDNGGLGYCMYISATNTSNANPVFFASVSTGARLMELDQTNSSNANNVLYVTTTNTAIAPIYAQGGTVNSHFQRMIASGSYQIWVSDGTSPSGSLSANIGDLCLGGTSGHPYWCGGGTTWTQI